jgi:hypothetical protein
MRKKREKPTLAVLADQIASARCIIEAQHALLKKLRAGGQSSAGAEAELLTYASSLPHLLAHADKLKEEALAKKGETKKKGQVGLSAKRAAEPELLFSKRNT